MGNRGSQDVDGDPEYRTSRVSILSRELKSEADIRELNICLCDDLIELAISNGLIETLNRFPGSAQSKEIHATLSLCLEMNLENDVLVKFWSELIRVTAQLDACVDGVDRLRFRNCNKDFNYHTFLVSDKRIVKSLMFRLEDSDSRILRFLMSVCADSQSGFDLLVSNDLMGACERLAARKQTCELSGAIATCLAGLVQFAPGYTDRSLLVLKTLLVHKRCCDDVTQIAFDVLGFAVSTEEGMKSAVRLGLAEILIPRTGVWIDSVGGDLESALDVLLLMSSKSDFIRVASEAELQQLRTITDANLAGKASELLARIRI
jgi:hypothetical protein